MAHAPAGPGGAIAAPAPAVHWQARLRAPWPAGLRAWLAGQLDTERERWFLWLPVALGCGVALYFALPVEPPSWLGLALLPPLSTVLAGPGARRVRASAWAPLLIGLAALALGFAAAQIRTQLAAAPALERRGAYQVEGRVVLVEDQVRGQRLTLADPVLADVPPEATPVRIRFGTRRTDAGFRPGDRVRARVLLMPPSAPAAPGDFDFARYAWFLRLGAVGYALGDVERVGGDDHRPAALLLARVRQRVASEIAEAVPGPAGAVANALLTGLRAAIPDQVWRDMQIAGLAHLLAISGLHLSLVAGTLFFGACIAIALVPPLALRIAGKKAAALVALIGAFLYLLLSGATVPTQRAFMMTALALTAVMLDRNPFSMRLVALAALVVLVFQPESLLGPSFQMSFAAVVALIATYETGLARRPDAASGLDRRLVLYVAGVALTTVIASLATAPFALYHFNRVATYGIVANLIAVPLTAFWIMPLGLAGLIVLPLGLHDVCFALMGRGIELVLVVAATVAQWPGAALALATPPDLALCLTVAGGLWLCLWRRPWRWLGLLGPASGLVLALLHPLPDLLIDRRGQLAAVRLADGRVALAPWERDRWVTDGWLGRFGATEAAPWPEPGTAEGGLRCDLSGCVLAQDGQVIALTRRPDALEEDCGRADLVVSYPRLERCPNGTPLIGPAALRRAGGMALWLDDGGIARLTAREARGERPWAR